MLGGLDPRSQNQSGKWAHPKANRDPACRQRKRERLHEPHIAPLTEFVRDLEVERGTGMVPWFDPDDAGINARVLLLFEAPGPKATGETGPRASERGSGFISIDNNDESAATTWQLFKELNVNRRDVVFWNIVPWYIGSDRRVRRAFDLDLDEARPALIRLLDLLPELRIIVLFGAKAQRGWLRAQIPFPVIGAPHTSPQSINPHPENIGLIRHALEVALREAAARPPYSLASTL